MCNLCHELGEAGCPAMAINPTSSHDLICSPCLEPNNRHRNSSRQAFSRCLSIAPCLSRYIRRSCSLSAAFEPDPFHPQVPRNQNTMAPPTPLAIATSSVNRLLKEEASYHKEVEQEEASIKALKEKIESGQDDEDGNGKYMLKQQVGHPTAPSPRAVINDGVYSKPPWNRPRPSSSPYERRSSPPSRSWRSRSP